MNERYFVGWQEPDGIQVAGASYQDEIYDRQAADPHAPLATCETAEDAARLVALLNRYEARLGALRGAAAAFRELVGRAVFDHGSTVLRAELARPLSGLGVALQVEDGGDG